MIGLICPADGQTVLHFEGFELCVDVSWTSVAAAADSDVDDEWTCSVEDISDAKMIVNGFTGPADDDWLISPRIDASGATDVRFDFEYRNVFEGEDIRLYYSTDFSGDYSTVALEAATWVEVSIDLFDTFQSEFVSNALYHPSLAISDWDDEQFYLAFRYTNTTSQSELWEVDDLRVTSDYYSDISDDLRCEELKTALNRLIDGHRTIPYSASELDVWDAYYTTDQRLSDDGTRMIVYDMSTDIPDGLEVHEFVLGEDQDRGTGGGSEGDKYNREHVMPRSWWGGANEPIDTQFFELYNLVPSDKYINNQKSSVPLGETDAPTLTTSNGTKVGPHTSAGYSGAVYEPIDAYKGDYARIYFYMATRYQRLIDDWEDSSDRSDDALSGDPFTAFEPWILDVLLRWHVDDPVSDKERQRNDAIYAIQRNRNPFVDRPSYVQMIWGQADGTVCDMVTSVITLETVDIECYPSPTTDLLRFSDASLQDIGVYDLAGRLVMQQDHLADGALSVSQLVAGQYIIRCTVAATGEVAMLRFGKF